jgi:hypothetical protein
MPRRARFSIPWHINHFTQKGYDTTTDPNTRYLLGANISDLNPQLQNLYRPVSDKNLSRCQQAQFYGEFLHTFEDTFAHRDENNAPFGSFFGHAIPVHDPDQTYNVQNSLGGGDFEDNADYMSNEARTLAMEEALYNRFITDWKTTPKASFAEIRDTLIAFNLAGKAEYEAYIRTHDKKEAEEEFEARKENELDLKIPILSKKLEELGLGTFDQLNSDLNVTQLDWYYDVDARLNRNTFLGNLKHVGPSRAGPDPYRGILLPGD